MRHLRETMGIIVPIPVANGGNRYEATMSTSEELQRQNDRLQLLLNLTSRITSSLDLREVLRAIAANIRQVIHADLVTVSLPDVASEKIRVFAMDFPHGKGGHQRRSARGAEHRRQKSNGHLETCSP